MLQSNITNESTYRADQQEELAGHGDVLYCRDHLLSNRAYLYFLIWVSIKCVGIDPY